VSSRVNLDRLAAQYAQFIVREKVRIKEDAETLDRVATKTAGVLQENGVYACILFLFSRPDKEELFAKVIREQFIKLLDSEMLKPLKLEFKGNKEKSQEVLKHFSDRVCGDLDELLLVKSLYEQTLIYTRYGAKARKVELGG